VTPFDEADRTPPTSSAALGTVSQDNGECNPESSPRVASNPASQPPSALLPSHNSKTVEVPDCKSEHSDVSSEDLDDGVRGEPVGEMVSMGRSTSGGMGIGTAAKAGKDTNVR
jgi:hypothetical protein